METGAAETSGASRLSVPWACAAIFLVAWTWAANEPRFPQDWALENVLSLSAAWWLLRRHRRAPLSSAAYMMLCVFGVLHQVGSHYTYAEVPYDDWSRALAGISINETLGFTRNHYDRLVHFLFGALCYRPLSEALPPLPGRIGRAAPVFVVAMVSLLYEQVEMAAALLFGDDLGQAYLGTQGDPWDAQKDSALALLGSLVAAMTSRRAG